MKMFSKMIRSPRLAVAILGVDGGGGCVGRLELPRYDGHLSIWANGGGEPWREEGEGGIRPSTRSGSWSW